MQIGMACDDTVYSSLIRWWCSVYANAQPMLAFLLRYSLLVKCS